MALFWIICSFVAMMETIVYLCMHSTWKSAVRPLSEEEMTNINVFRSIERITER